MLRTGASRALFRSLRTPSTHGTVRLSFLPTSQKPQLSSRLHTLSSKRPQTCLPTIALGVRYAASTQWDKIDLEAEKKAAQKKLEPHPELVSSTSSMHPVLGPEIGQDESSNQNDSDPMAGLKNDMKTIKDTFTLEDVPKEAFAVGLAGLIPYFATSVGTVYCSWEIQHAAANATGFLMSGKTAELWLHLLEPLQVGYGAVILSFLGAIHWGLEWAGYGGHHNSRYAVGVIAPAVAWPTLLLPLEYALITQFLAFTGLYYHDTRATRKGTVPPWYGTYRFVLTFVVGVSIVISLIGRSRISDQVGKLPGPNDRVRALRENSAAELSKEEHQARARIVGKKEMKDEYSSGKIGVNK